MSAAEQNNNSTSGEFRRWIQHFMKEFEKVYGDNYLQYKRKDILGKDATPEESETDISIKRLKALDDKMDRNIEYYSDKTLLIQEAKTMIDSLRPLYDDLMDLHSQENVLVMSLVAIGDIVRSRIGSRNAKVHADLMNQMGTPEKTDANAEEYDKNSQIATDILVTLDEGFADFDQIYANIKQQIPDLGAEMDRDEGLIRQMEEAYGSYDTALDMVHGTVPIRPIVDDNVDRVISELTNPVGGMLMVDVYENVVNDTPQAGGAPVVGSTPMHVDDDKYSIGEHGFSELQGEDEVPPGVQIFFNEGKTPATVMKKLLGHINKNENLKKIYLIKRSDKDFKKVVESVLYRCHEIDVLTAIEIFKVIYFVSNIVFVSKINSNMYSAIVKVYYAMEIYYTRDEEFMLPFDIVKQLMKYIGTQGLLINSGNNIEDRMDQMTSLLGNFSKVGVGGLQGDNFQKVDSHDVVDGTGEPVGKVKAMRKSDGSAMKPGLALGHSSGQVGGGKAEGQEEYPEASKSKFMTLAGKDYAAHPIIAERLSKATDEQMKVFNRASTQYLDEYSDRLPFVTSDHFVGEPDEEKKKQALQNHIQSAANIFRLDNQTLKERLNNYVSTGGIVPLDRKKDLITQFGGAKKLFDWESFKDHWTSISDDRTVKRTVKELFMRCYIIQNLFIIEFEKAMTAGGILLVKYLVFYKLVEIYIILLSLLHVITYQYDDVMIPPAVVEASHNLLASNKIMKELNRINGMFDSGIDVTGDIAQLKLGDFLNRSQQIRDMAPNDPVFSQRGSQMLPLLSDVSMKPYEMNIELTGESFNRFKEKFSTVVKKFGGVTDESPEVQKKEAIDVYNGFWSGIVNTSTEPMHVWLQPLPLKQFKEAKDMVRAIQIAIESYNLTPPAASLVPDSAQSGGGKKSKVNVKHHRTSRRNRHTGGGPENNNNRRNANAAIAKAKEEELPAAQTNGNKEAKSPAAQTNASQSELVSPPVTTDKIPAAILTVKQKNGPSVNLGKRYHTAPGIYVHAAVSPDNVFVIYVMFFGKNVTQDDKDAEHGIKINKRFFGDTKFKGHITSINEVEVATTEQWISRFTGIKQGFDNMLKQTEAERKEAQRLRKDKEDEIQRQKQAAAEADRVRLEEEAAARAQQEKDRLAREQADKLERLRKEEEERKRHQITLEEKDIFSSMGINVKYDDEKLVKLKQDSFVFTKLVAGKDSIGEIVYKVVKSLVDFIATMKKATKTERVREASPYLQQFVKFMDENKEFAYYYINNTTHGIANYFEIHDPTAKTMPELYSQVIPLLQVEPKVTSFKESYKINGHNIYEVIMDINERILGQARVIVTMRDDASLMEGGSYGQNMKAIIDQFKKQKGGEGSLKPIAVDSGSDKCVVTTSVCDGELHIKPSDNDKYANKCYGVFKNVFTNATPQDVFTEEFKSSGLIKNTICKGGNLVVFGFGFSGSGKTFLLLNSDNNILESTIKYILSGKCENKVVSIGMKFKELYPIDDGSGNFILDTESYKEEEDVINGAGKNVTGAEQFMSVVKAQITRIEKKRFSKMQIAATPNNIVSSRSHIMFEIIINFAGEGNKAGRLTLVDMAGSENTIEIKQMFLNIPGLKKTDHKQYQLDSLRTLYKKTLTSKLGQRVNDMLLEQNTRRIINKIYFSLLGKVFNEQKYAEDIEKYLFEQLKDQMAPYNKAIHGNANPKVEDIQHRISARNLPKILLGLPIVEINVTLSYKDFYIDASRTKVVGANHVEFKDYPKIIQHFIGLITKPHEITDSLNFNDERYKALIKHHLKSLNIDYADHSVILNTIGKLGIMKNHFATRLDEMKGTEGTAKINNPFLVIFCAIEHIMRNQIETMIEKEGENDAMLLFYHIILLKTCLKYINFIVKQGKGIVTTLEHLKYMFLYRTAEHIGLINYNNTAKSDRKYEIKDGKRLQVDSIRYKVPKKIRIDKDDANKDEEGDNSVTISEWVEMGKMKQTRMLELLHGDADIEWSKTKSISDGQHTYTVPELPDLSLKNKFVMFTAIKRGYPVKKGSDIVYETKDNLLSKYCGAMRDTLEFAQAITSGIGSCNACPAPAAITASASATASGGYIEIKRKDRTSKRRGHKNGKRSRRGYRNRPSRTISVYSG